MASPLKDTLPQYAVVTTNHERFSGDESALLAALIYKRFGFDGDAAAAAWSRLLQSNVPKSAFLELAAYALPHLAR